MTNRPSTEPPPMILADNFMEHHNVAWRVEPACEDPENPLLEPEYPWESAAPCSGHGTVLKDPIDGVYKAWVVAIEEDVGYTRGNHHFRLVYLRSEDGVTWEKPLLDLCPRPGCPNTNILFDYDSGGRATYASVFVDPDADPDEPYEMFCYRDPMWKNPGFRVAGFDQEPIDDLARGYAERYGLYRYRSRDGLHWRGVEGPIAFKSGDTLNVHRHPDGGYVAHHKNSVPSFPGGFYPYDVAAGECRINLRKTSADGTHWSESVPIMMPDFLDHQGDQIMEVGHYPWGQGLLGLTAIYHGASQRMDMQWAASLDGIRWWRPSRQPCLANAPLGEYGGGMIWPTRTLVEDRGRLHFYYGAHDGLHGDIYQKTDNCLLFHGAFCHASWEVGRLWAAVQASGGRCMEGYLTCPPANHAGQRLILNARTRRDGRIRAELRALDGTVLDGYGCDDGSPFTGDSKSGELGWANKPTAPEGDICLRLYIRDAFLYGFDWR